MGSAKYFFMGFLLSKKIILEIVFRIRHINASMKNHLHAPLQLMSSGQLFTSEIVQKDLVARFQCPIYEYAFCDIVVFPITFLLCPQRQDMLE